MWMLYVLGFVVFVLFTTVKILSEWERGVILRFGRSVGVRGSGFNYSYPRSGKDYPCGYQNCHNGYETSGCHHP